ncbi:alcohol dehydrogenase [Purpureocillium lilacinum]|uniref:alcohol dehydrogenase n=1 Tax=Purpureocillium lilacinum TaxID=33203 RepID=UPI0020800031|nr:alcohol dehydrogenase [Purpureocillium lilacinum]
MAQLEVPAEQWAQVVEQNGGPPIYKKIPVPNPGSDEVLVHILYSGVCHTDLHAMKGDWPLKRKMPFIGGHEGAGVVVARGDLVQNINIGDRVGIKWLNSSCLSCSFCMQGDEPLCPHALLSGYTVDGTFQQYAVGKASHVTRIPKDCDLAAIAPVLCAGVTVYKGLKESSARPAEYVAIVGAGGGLGSLAIQFSKAMGLRAIAIDRGEEKGTLCRSLGAETYIDYTTSNDVAADIKNATRDGLGPHCALIIAPQEEPFHHATRYLRSRGVIVCIGMPSGAYLKAPIFDVVVRMLSIKGSYVGNRLDADEAVEFFRAGLIKVPSKVVPLSKLSDVFESMAAGEIVGRYVLNTAN